jgi:plasmid stability protein
MAQLTIRADDELVHRVKDAAASEGRSMNDYVTSVLDAATNPDLESDRGERLRARLRAAGLLWEPPPGSQRPRPDPKAVAAAAKRLGRGTPLSEYVSRNRD